MKKNRHSFPHPVLNWRDDIVGTFTCSLKWKADADNFYLSPQIELDNESLNELIKQKKAQYTMHVHCRQTLYRNSFHFDYENTDPFYIASEKLRDSVDVNFYITASQEIYEYINKSAHSDYSGHTFPIEKNTILGIGGRSTFFAYKQYDALNSVGSIMQIIQGDKKKAPVQAEFSGDKIIVDLCKEDYKIYFEIKRDKEAAKILHSSLVLPVLMEALRKMKEDSSVSETNWFKVIQKRMDNHNLNLEDEYIVTAQKLLSNPQERTFGGINDLIRRELEND